MADHKGYFALLSFFLLCFTTKVAEAGEYCYTYNYLTQYCVYGCCGSYGDYYCCSANIGLIVGCVIGGIVLIGGIVAVVCYCLKQNGQSRRVIQPVIQPAAANVSVMYSGSQMVSGQQPQVYAGGYSYAVPAGDQPPAYNNPGFKAPPPAYAYSNPA